MKKTLALGLAGLPRRKRVLLLVCSVVLMTLTFNFIILDAGNTGFEMFQSDSEELALGAFQAGVHGLHLPGFGLGTLHHLRAGPAHRQGFENGFSLTDPQVLYERNPYTMEYLLPGFSVRFPSGQVREIIGIERLTDTDYKGHSFVHTHMNFVLWYFGFMQLALYLVLSTAWRFLAKQWGKPAV